MDFLTHPVVVSLVAVLIVAWIIGGLTHASRERRRVDAVINQEGEQHKDLTGSSRDSRKQGTVPVGSDIEGLDRSRSDRSKQSMEERVVELRSRRILLDGPLSLQEAESKLDEAQQALAQTQRNAVWHRHPELIGPKVQQAQQAVEECREVRNRILIESQDRTVTCRGRIRSGRQYIIGVEPRSAI